MSDVLYARGGYSVIRRCLVMAIAGCAVALSGAAARDVDAHLVLTKSAPGSDEVVASPHEIRLWFSDEPDRGATSVRLSVAEGSTASVGNPEASPDDPRVIVTPVDRTLTPGLYAVSWSTTGSDGHEVFGDFTFTVTAK